MCGEHTFSERRQNRVSSTFLLVLRMTAAWTTLNLPHETLLPSIWLTMMSQISWQWLLPTAMNHAQVAVNFSTMNTMALALGTIWKDLKHHSTGQRSKPRLSINLYVSIIFYKSLKATLVILPPILTSSNPSALPS